ncbi:MAG: ABC transporter permease, partial [Gemmatimonadota bacterium]|nr:ABC transporter permease [Gemmatimonadota bacterium]
GLDIDVLAGRSFTEGDSGLAHPVAVLNARAAERFFGRVDATGRRLQWPADQEAEGREYEIVGVVEDIRARDVLVPPEPAVFLSHLQHPFPSGSALHIAVEGDPALQVPAVEQWLRRYEPHLAIVNVLTYRDVVRGSLYGQRMNAEMFTVLAAMALLLAAFGIFTVLTVSVGRRRREIGVRRALGAKTSNVRWLMLGRAAVPVLLGLAVGLAGAAVAGEVVRGLLYGVEPGDPATLGGGILVFLTVALAAASGPVRKAVRVAPAEALKDG